MSLKVVFLFSLLSIGLQVESKGLPRVKREPGVGSHAGSNAAGDIGSMILGAALDSTIQVEQVGGCGLRWGCHNGYCWTGCDATAINNEWCYTTRGWSQDYKYVRCSRDSECERCWACAGSCTV